MKRLITATALSLALAIGLAPGSASAEGLRERGGLFDRSTQDRSPQLSFWGLAMMPWYYDFGAGGAVRFAIPIVPQGFIPKLNDSFELELGGDLFYAHHGSWDYVVMAVPVEARWTFHLTRRFAAYGKVGAGFQYAFGEHDYYGYDYLHWNVAPGVIFEPSKAIALRAEVGYNGLRLGVGFNF